MTTKVKSRLAFGVRLFYVECDDCMSWVKSSVGQNVWETKRQAVINARKHTH